MRAQPKETSNWNPWTVRLALLLSVATAGCTSLAPQAVSPPRFQEAARAGLIVQFYSWQHFHILRPDYRQDGFLVPVSRATLSQHLRGLHVDRSLAVVVIGSNYDAEEQAKLIDDWKNLLWREGFQRVVCLQGTGGRKVDGLVILEDSRLTLHAASPQMGRVGQP